MPKKTRPVLLADAFKSRDAYLQLVQVVNLARTRPNARTASRLLSDFLRKEPLVAGLWRMALEDESTYEWYAERDHALKGSQWLQASRNGLLKLALHLLGSDVGATMEEMDEVTAKVFAIVEEFRASASGNPSDYMKPPRKTRKR